MRPVAVLADIHGNLEALNTVLKELEPLNPRAYLVLGDSFGELGAATEVYEMLVELRPIWIMGNREMDMAALCRGERESWKPSMQFAPMVKSALDLGEIMETVADWPIHRQWEGLRLAHGSPEGVRELLYPGTARLDSLLDRMDEDMMVVGHDHRQWYYGRGEKQLLAVGSLGLCHVGRPFRSQYGLLWQEDGRWRGRLCETGYDGSKVAARLKKSGWLENTGIVVRVSYEEIACGYETLRMFIKTAHRISIAEYGKILTPLPNWIMEQAARIYPWKSEL